MVGACCNHSLGLVTKAKICKGAGQKWNPGFAIHVLESVGECEGMNPTLPGELPVWKLETQWTFESSEGDCRGQNSLEWRVASTIGNFLELRCLKWARMTHLNT
jgi:hypothetical protein